MRPISRFEDAQIWVARIVHVSSPQRHSEPAGPRRLIRELGKKLKDLRGNSTLSEKRISV